jgi:CheY-like chemotaxis protein
MRAKSKKILIAEDDATVRFMLSLALEWEHYEVACAHTWRDAVAKFRAAPPDLALLDCSQPQKEAREAVELMRASVRDLPVVLISNHSSQHAELEQLQADALLEKPIELPRLLDTIRQLLEQPRAARAARLAPADAQTARLMRPPESPRAQDSHELAGRIP